VVDAPVGDRLVRALSDLEAVTREVTVDDALAGLDEATLEVFWRDWPSLRGWAETLWQRLNDDLATPASPVTDPDLDEVGDGG
jgi:hypothetical protein